MGCRGAQAVPLADENVAGGFNALWWRLDFKRIIEGKTRRIIRDAMKYSPKNQEVLPFRISSCAKVCH